MTDMTDPRVTGFGAAKKAIPAETRRAVARRAGAEPFTRTLTTCFYCGRRGLVCWMTRSWVHFRGLELDHVVPEFLGGSGTADNIVLACRGCNRQKGWRRTAEQMTQAGTRRVA